MTSRFISRYVAVIAWLLTLPQLTSAKSLVCDNDTSCREQVRAVFKWAQQEPKPALNMFVALYEKFPDPRLIYNIARMQHQLGRYPDAVESYRKYLESGIEIEPRQYQKAQAYLQQARQAAASASQTAPVLVSASPPTPPPVRLNAEQLFIQGKDEEAMNQGRTEALAGSKLAWRTVGLAACRSKHPIVASEAYQLAESTVKREIEDACRLQGYRKINGAFRSIAGLGSP